MAQTLKTSGQNHLGQPPKSPNNDFSSELLKVIKINSKNRKLRRRSHKTGEKPETSPEMISIPTQSKLASFKLKLPVDQIDEITEQSSEDHLDQFSPIIWFLLSRTSVKNMIPDIEFINLASYRPDPRNPSGKSHEDYFKLGRLHCHESDFVKAIHFFNKAKVLAPKVDQYKIWKSMAMIKSLNNFSKTKERSSSCCSSRSNLSKRDYLMKIVNKVVNLQSSIEGLWCIMEISLLGVLIIGEEIEPSRFYASKIKKMNEYYGLLAWCQILLKESNKDAESFLLELMSTYPTRPEPFYLSWNLFFSKKKYDRSKEVAVEAFIKITSSDFENFYIIFCLNLAKSYYYSGEFTNCIELLHKKYVEHPNFPIFLYALSKYCVLSEDFAYAGVAKGNLRELLRLSDDSRRINIYYLLFKSYWLTRQFPQSFKYAFKLTEMVAKGQKFKKKTETEKKMYELQPFVVKIHNIQEKIHSRKVTQDDLQDCEEIRDFHRPTADLLTADLLYLLENRSEAISLLKTMISTSRLETSAFFKLLEYDPLNSEGIFKGLLARAKNSQIPTQVWVRANLLYAKFMFKSSHYNKCFYVLRILAKMLPPLPYLHLPYCLSLQMAENLQDLANAFSKIDTNQQVFKPKPQVSVLNLNLKEATHKISEDKALPISSAPARRVQKKEGKCYKKFSSLAINVDQDDSQAESIFSPGEGDVSSFCVCSKPKFLYYIAKFSGKIGRNKAEGLLAIKDYMELMKLEKNTAKREARIRKAKEVEIHLGLIS
jgi:tetratricopeptide (TPR) repeat protein